MLEQNRDIFIQVHCISIAIGVYRMMQCPMLSIEGIKLLFADSGLAITAQNTKVTYSPK